MIEALHHRNIAAEKPMVRTATLGNLDTSSKQRTTKWLEHPSWWEDLFLRPFSYAKSAWFIRGNLERSTQDQVCNSPWEQQDVPWPQETILVERYEEGCRGFRCWVSWHVFGLKSSTKSLPASCSLFLYQVGNGSTSRWNS